MYLSSKKNQEENISYVILVIVAILIIGMLVFYSIGQSNPNTNIDTNIDADILNGGFDVSTEEGKLELLKALKSDNQANIQGQPQAPIDEETLIKIKTLSVVDDVEEVPAEEKAKILESLKN